jgi:hypothetical protein
MRLGALLAKALTGETTIRDFVTVGIDESIRETVYLRVGERTLDVTANQWLLGLDPRVVGIWLEPAEHSADLKKASSYHLYFMGSVPAHERQIETQALAVLHLEPFTTVEHQNGTLMLLKVLSSEIRHLNFLKLRLLYWRYYRKPGVSFERTKAVAAAYSYPRRVRIISFGQGLDYNYIFPMDLLADIRQSGIYLLGMRHSNQVLTRIMTEKKIVVSEVSAEYKPLIYQLGRNHSASPPPLAELPCATLPSKEFGFHIPEWAQSYKEIHIRQTVDLGSHMLLFGEWQLNEIRKPATPRLHHIHFLHYLESKNNGLGYPVV